MVRLFRKFVPVLTLCFLLPLSAWAQIDTYGALQSAVLQARDNDILVISGMIDCGEGASPLQGAANVVIRGAENSDAEIYGLHIDSMSVSFSNVNLTGGLTVMGNSRVQLMSGTRVDGAPSDAGITMTGGGMLQIDKDSAVFGGSNTQGQAGDGIVLTQDAADDIHLIIEGEVAGGRGKNGGSALTLSGLAGRSSVTLAGAACGGNGDSAGGNAINLYDMGESANAELAGTIRGGTGGRTGGNAMQIVNASGDTAIHFSGTARGGDGGAYGGDTVIAMNVTGTLVLSGALYGGDIQSDGDRPGAALLLLDADTTAHTTILEARLQDGTVLPPQTTDDMPDETPQGAEETATPQMPDAPEEAEPCLPDTGDATSGEVEHTEEE